MMTLTLLCLDYKVADVRANVHSVAAFSGTHRNAEQAPDRGGGFTPGWCGVVCLSQSFLSIILSF